MKQISQLIKYGALIIGIMSLPIIYLFLHFCLTTPSWKKTVGDIISKNSIHVIDCKHSYDSFLAGTDYSATFLFKAKDEEIKKDIIQKLSHYYLLPDNTKSGEYVVTREFGKEYADSFSGEGQMTFFSYNDALYTIYIGQKGFFCLEYFN